ncbi:hypothetical protein IAT38_003147 [Cryptococcus sp. DSM 104549]
MSAIYDITFRALAARADYPTSSSLSTPTNGNSTNAAASAAGKTTAAAAAGGAAPEQSLIQSVEDLPPLFLLFLAGGLLLLFLLSNIPRQIARLLSSSHGGDFWKGNALSSKAPKGADDPVVMQYAKGLDPGEGNPPMHWPSMSAVIPGAGLLGIGVRGAHMTVGQMMVCAAWAGLLVTGMWYMNDPLLHGVRAGFCSLWLVPIVVILGTKVNVVGALVGRGYEKLNYLHRVAATFHAGVYVVKWAKAGTLAEKAAVPKFTAGFVAWAGFAFMGATSVPFIRTRMYGFFWISHWIGFIVAIIGLAYHYPYTAFIGIISLVIYAKDILLRLILKTRLTRACLVALPGPSSDPSSGSIQISLGLRSGWRAGQHVFIRVPALHRVGGAACWENHPFTIASAEGEEMVLVVKKAGDWTRALWDLAARGGVSGVMGSGGIGEKEKGYVEAVKGTECRVLVEGPYGGPCSLVFSSYSSVMLITGGSGVTFALAVLEDLIHKSFKGHTRARTVHFVWICKTYDDAAPLIPHLTDLLSRASSTYLTPKITLFLTRGNASTTSFARGIDVYTCRPDICEFVDAVVNRTRVEVLSGGVNMSGLVIGTSGPVRLVEETKKAARKIPWKAKRDIGGVTVHTEAFGW